MVEEGGIGAVGDDQGAPEMGFQHGAQDDSHDHRCGGKIGMLHEVADDPEDQGDIDLRHAVVGGIGAGDGDDQDEGKEKGEGDLQHLDPDADQGKVNDQEEEISDIEAGDQPPDQLRAFLE